MFTMMQHAAQREAHRNTKAAAISAALLDAFHHLSTETLDAIRRELEAAGGEETDAPLEAAETILAERA